VVRFITRRLVFFLFTLILTSIIIFTLTRVLPGDVARTMLGREASQAQVESLRQELGLDRPLLMQYVDWASSFARGDWGRTFSRPRQEILGLVLRRTLNSARLAVLTLMIAVPLSILLGVIAGLNESRLPDNIISILALTMASVPEFVTGILLINIFALGLGWFPASSAVRSDAALFEALPSMWLPALTATLVLIAYISHLTRASVIQEVKKEYVRTAALKGLPQRTVVFRHVLCNALIPTITVIATSTGWLISGLVVTEFVFGYPGLGRLLMFAIEKRDLPTVQAIVMVTVITILVANFVADILYAAINPRIKLK